jgi:hypothetical protein
MDALRKPFFIAAVVLMLLVVSVEIGGGLLLKGSFSGDMCGQLPEDYRSDCQNMDPEERQALQQDVPGLGIPYLALMDGVLLFSMLLMASALIIPAAIHGRLQGCATAIFAILLILAAIVMIILAITKLLLMVGLLLAAPFGTIAYFIMFAFFNRGGGNAILAALMLAKIGFVVCILLAQQHFLRSKALIVMILSSFLGNIIISFLWGLVPIFLVSITDAIAAIVVAILGVIWLVVLLIGAIPAILKALTRT